MMPVIKKKVFYAVARAFTDKSICLNEPHQKKILKKSKTA
jgi:hypothetical protein